MGRLDSGTKGEIASNAMHAIEELKGLVSLHHEGRAWSMHDAALSRLHYIGELLEDAGVPRPD